MYLQVLKQLTLLGLLVTAIPIAFAGQEAKGLQPWLQETMSLADARHLVGRTGFGASAQELAALVGLTRAQAVEQVVSGIKTTPHIPMPSWVEQPAPRFWKRRALSSEAQQAFDRDRDGEITQLRQWWVSNMLQSDSAQTERLVMFWHDHFATSYKGVNRRSISLARQNQTFRELGTGSYRTFLKAMIRDPALLIYLDNQSNRKGRPNENLARELLELFTLGEGNYDEATVKESARALTGYGFSDTRNHTFRFYSYKHDNEDKTLFGVTANHDGDSLIDLILEQPEAAEHLVKKYWVAFVSDRKPDSTFVLELAQSFRQSDYDLLLLYKSVLQSQQFWDDTNRLSLIKSPVTLLIGTARSLDFPKRAWSQLASLHALLGMELFAPPNVSGWKEGAAFVAPGRLLNRQLALQTLLEASELEENLAPESMMSEPMMSESTMSESTMSESTMSESTMSESIKSEPMMSMQTAPLQVRLAGHLFKGAPQFRIALHAIVNEQDKQLWVSEKRTLKIGYDTQMYGAMQNRSVLPWVNEKYSPPKDALGKATRVEIAFLNDAADKTGDRNLFIESVTLNSQTFSAVGATQVSGCIPKNKRAAGNLYCAGSVSIDVRSVLPSAIARTAAFSATDASVIWTKNLVGKNGDGRLNAIIALENVQTPDNFYHTLSFHLVSLNQQSAQIRLDSFGCWPDCIENWPACAWQENSGDASILKFPLTRGRRNDNSECHYEHLTGVEQQLVNALWKSVPSLVNHVAKKETIQPHAGNLKLWQKRLGTLDKKLHNNDYVGAAQLIDLNANYAVPGFTAMYLPEPRILIDSLTDYEQQVEGSDLSLTDLLIGGADIAGSAQLNVNSNRSIQAQLEYLFSHPVYQVY